MAINLTGSVDAVLWAARDRQLGDDEILRLGHGLAFGLDRAARVIPSRVRRRIKRAWINQCAGTAYLVLADRQPRDLVAALRRSEAEAIRNERINVTQDAREQRIKLAALLVHDAFLQDWQELRLADPLARDADPESFYRKYIGAGLPAARKNPRRQRDAIARLLALGVEARFWWLTTAAQQAAARALDRPSKQLPS